MRSLSSVLMIARPTAPPRLRVRLNRPGGVLDALGRQRAERDVVDRDHRQHQPDAAQDLRHEQLPEVPVLREVTSSARCRARRAGSRSISIRRGSILLRISMPGDRRRDEHGEAGDEHRLADHQRVVAADPREIDADRDRSGRRGRCRARRRTASRRRSCGWRRRVRSTIGSLRREERARRRATQPSAETDGAAAAIESSSNQSLRGPSSSTYSSAPRKPAIDEQARPVELRRTARSPACRSRSAFQAAMATTMPGMTLMRNSQCQEKRVGEIAADRRADRRRQRRDEADHRRDDRRACERGKIGEGGGEDGRDHAAADEALDRAVDDHLVDVRRSRAQQARGGEAGGGDARTARACEQRATGSPTAGS